MKVNHPNGTKHKVAIDNIGTSRQKLGLVSFCLVGGTPALYYIYLSGAVYPSYVDWLITGGAIFLYLNAIGLFFHNKYHLSAVLCGVGITPAMLALVASGGYENTGLFWVFPYVFAIFMFLGHFKGALINIITFICIAIMLYSPNLIDATYSNADITRFLASFLVSIFLCFCAEYFKLRSYSQLATLTKDKDKLANTDALTGLPNRRFIDSSYIKDSHLYPEEYFPISLLWLDLDNFKRINDTLGHAVGDNVLKHVSACLLDSVRSSDIVCRVGGEEFIILISQTTLSSGIAIAEKVRDNLERSPFSMENNVVKITASIGIVEITPNDDFADVMKKADKLLYQAKNKGKNRVEYQVNTKLQDA